MKCIDPHVHLRDWSQAQKETLSHGFDVAWRAGISAVFEMPNTTPTLTDRATVLRRIADADRARESGIFHGLYMGLTDDVGQVREAVDVQGQLFPRVVGFKLYAGHSTGRMGVIGFSQQRLVWKTLADSGYRGVVAVHAEREELLRPTLWDPTRPESHSETRPPVAEIASVQTQIDLAEAAGFRGTLHICHVSTPETVALVEGERSGLPFAVTMGVTPHHVLLDLDYVAAAWAAGTQPTPEFSVNPPLRDRDRRSALYDRLRTGGLDWIESDHAPHTWEDKLARASGLPGLPAFRLLAERLIRGHNEGTSPSSIEPESLLGGRVLDVFGIDPDLIPENPNLMRSWRLIRDDLSSVYPWDPYRFLDF